MLHRHSCLFLSQPSPSPDNVKDTWIHPTYVHTTQGSMDSTARFLGYKPRLLLENATKKVTLTPTNFKIFIQQFTSLIVCLNVFDLHKFLFFS